MFGPTKSKCARCSKRSASAHSKRRVGVTRVFLVILLSSVLSACASYQSQMTGALTSFRDGRPGDAAKQLKEKAEKENDDQVVFLFEYATALQAAGDYKESTKYFLKAEDVVDVKDYHSISRVAGSVLLNEGLVQYKGEDYEKVFINAMLAINFLAVGDLDAAQVETRKLNTKLYKYKYEAKRDYNQDPFAFYLSAMIWEANRQWDDAYIDYKKVYELNPNIPYLKEDLLRASRMAQRPEEFDKWRRQFGTSKFEDHKGKGEIVLLFEQGWAPRKYPHPQFPKIPKLVPVTSLSDRGRISIINGPKEDTQVITSVQNVAVKTLDDQYAGLIGKRVAGIVVKEVVADQIRQKNEALGQLAWIGLHIADQADLRSWLSLPETFQVARVVLRPGKYTLRAEGVSNGSATGEKSPEITVEVKAGKKVFIPWRAVR